MEPKTKKKMGIKTVLLAILVLIVIGGLVWIVVRASRSNAGSVEGTKTSANEEQTNTVGEDVYFSSKAKIMYFYSDQCHWCQQEKTILGQLGYEGYRFKPMNVGKDTSLWQKYEIEGTPTFIAANGDKLIGYQEKDALQAWMDSHGAKPTK